jgi:hypothetical protein
LDQLSLLPLLRRLWIGFAVGIAVMVTVAVAAGDPAATLPAVLPAGLAATGGAGAVVAARAIDRTFAATPPADDRAALVEFRTRSFLQVAIAEAPTLLAFALTFVMGPRWVAIIGGVASLTTLWVSRPTVRRVAAIEGAWQRGGHDVSILRAACDTPQPADQDGTD